VAEGRMIRRKIAIDAKFNRLTRAEQWLFMRMLPFADDEGKLTGDLEELKLEALPGANVSINELQTLLSGMKAKSAIGYNQGLVIKFNGWRKHQKLNHRPALSIYPDIVDDAGKGQQRLDKVDTIKEVSKEEKGSKVNKESKERHIDRSKPDCLNRDFIKAMEDKFPEVDVRYELDRYLDFLREKTPVVKDHQAKLRNWLRNDWVKKIKGSKRRDFGDGTD